MSSGILGDGLRTSESLLKAGFSGLDPAFLGGDIRFVLQGS